MSQESSLWLNQNTLIGFTDERGHAWHYRADDQGDEANHYIGAVPVEDVVRRLFHWKAVEGDVVSTAMTPEGVITVTDPDRKTIIRPDTGVILGVFKDGYAIHDYEEWLLKQVAFLLDDDLGIGSAGLLKQGGLAWVQVEVPKSITTPEGVEFRPHLLAATSLDGSLSTTYKRSVTNVVCDNTMAASLGEAGERIKVKHSRYSKVKLQDARAALALVHETADEFAAEVAELTNVTVTEDQWAKFVDGIASLTDDEGKKKEGRALTMAETKREQMDNLWNHDTRVSPWKNTAWGVVQAMNTATHHVFTVHGDRAERNMLKAVTGEWDKFDRETLESLQPILAD